MFIKNLIVGTMTVLTFTVVALIVPIMVSTDGTVGVSTVSAFGSSEDGGCCGGSDPKPKPKPKPPTKKPAICQYLNADKVTLPYGGGDVTLTWATSRATLATLSPDGSSVELNSSKTVSITNDTTFVLNVSNDDGSDNCSVSIDVEEPVVTNLTCSDVDFTASDYLVTTGDEVALAYTFTGNVESASIDQGIGEVFSGEFTSVTVTEAITYAITIANASSQVSCPLTIDIETVTEAPRCVAFTASPTSLPYGGGQTTLTWEAANADSITIDNGVLASTAVLTGATDVTVTNDITYTMTVSAAGYDDVTCPASITVGDPVEEVFSCTNNATFSVSDTSLPRGGGDVTFTWDVTDADSVSIAGLTSTNHSDTEVKNVTSDSTYILTATKDGFTTISCPVSIDVKTGGGGSSSPRCDLDISDEKIKAGQEITLTWDTTRAREVKITDNHGNVLLDSEDSDDFDGDMKIKPTKDTEYTLLSKRGTREKTCKVEVEIPNHVTVLQTRTHEPRVAGISLTQVPYTGFEAGPAMTIIFYALLTIWGLFVAYIFVIRRDSIGGVSLAGAHDHVSFTDVSVEADTVEESSVAEGYVDAVVASTEAPSNLPTAAVAPVIGYAATLVEDEATDESIEMTELENRAHAQKALLSSDAMRFFMNATEAGETRNEKLDAAIAEAKTSFPSEGGWVALNLARIETLISDKDAEVAVEAETTPITGGSLAEAIVDGNVVAAYQMIAHRPMIALADAAADLDAVYRSRKGEEVTISNMLTTSAAAISTEKLEGAITALTGALDGTYDSEAEAVKMAIMKAVKAVS